MKKIFALIAVVAGNFLFAGEPLPVGEQPVAKEESTTIKNMFKRSGSGANALGQRNVTIKMNLSQALLTNLSFQGEIAFHPKMSFALGFSTLLNRDLPGSLYAEDPFFSPPRFGGWAVTPEFRFYPGGKEEKGAPKGFYLAPYFRYAKYKLTQTVSYQDLVGVSTVYSAEAAQTYGGYTTGLMIGHQWVLNSGFTIDWWIIGGGYGKSKYTYGWTVPGVVFTDAQQAEYKADVQDYLGGYSFFNSETTVRTTSNSATVEMTGLPMISMRFMGLCLGYSF